MIRKHVITKEKFYNFEQFQRVIFGKTGLIMLFANISAYYQNLTLHKYKCRKYISKSYMGIYVKTAARHIGLAAVLSI